MGGMIPQRGLRAHARIIVSVSLNSLKHNSQRLPRHYGFSLTLQLGVTLLPVRLARRWMKAGLLSIAIRMCTKLRRPEQVLPEQGRVLHQLSIVVLLLTNSLLIS